MAWLPILVVSGQGTWVGSSGSSHPAVPFTSRVLLGLFVWQRHGRSHTPFTALSKAPAKRGLAPGPKWPLLGAPLAGRVLCAPAATELGKPSPRAPQE